MVLVLDENFLKYAYHLAGNVINFHLDQGGLKLPCLDDFK